MKTTSIAAAFLLSACVVIAQGTVTFVNNVPGQVVAPIYGPEAGNVSVQKSGNTASGFPAGTQVYTGSPLSGAGWSAQLLGAPGTQPESSLVALSAVTPFGANGFIVPLTFAPPFPGGTTTATYQMVAWDNQGG